MSTMEVEQGNRNTADERNATAAGEENEKKGIESFDELLEQGLVEEEDSVDSFIKRVGEASEESSEFGLHYEDETSVVTDSALYSSKEEISSDNNSSSLEKEIKVTIQGEKEMSIKIADESCSSSQSLQDEGDGGEERLEAAEHEEATVSGEGKEGDSEKKEETDATANENSCDAQDDKDSEMVNEVCVDDTKTAEVEEVERSAHECSEGTAEEAEGDEDDVVMSEAIETEVVSEMESKERKQVRKEKNSDIKEVQSAGKAHNDVLYIVFHPKEAGKQKGEAVKKIVGQLNVHENETDSKIECDQNNSRNSESATEDNLLSVESVSSADQKTSEGDVEKRDEDNIHSRDKEKSSENKDNDMDSSDLPHKEKSSENVENGNTDTIKESSESSESNSDENKNGGHDNLISTKSDEPEEKLVKTDELRVEREENVMISGFVAKDKTVKPNVILTRKVYGKIGNVIKKSGNLIQVKPVPGVDSGETVRAEVQGHHPNPGGNRSEDGDKSVKISVNTKVPVLVGKEGKKCPEKMVIVKRVGEFVEKSPTKGEFVEKSPTKGEFVEKGSTNFGTIKRKLDELYKKSKEEEEAVMEEIKRMKKEKLDVLDKINSEMEKLKTFFLAGKQKAQK